MKKKNLVLVGIAICAILLISPVLASASYSNVYGNANEDDVLDMRDVTYIKLVIFGKKPATTFADANYDGKISMLDVGQTKLIILGKEKKLTLVDMADRTVTLRRPIERVVTSYVDITRIIVAFGECDKVVGVNSYSPICLCYHPDYKSGGKAELCTANVCGGKLYELPVVGSCVSIDNLELTVSLKPDVIFAYGAGEKYIGDANTVQEKTGIPVICAKSGGHKFEEMDESIEIIGTVLEKEEEAEELISFIEEKVDKVREVTSEIPENEKPKVYFATRGVTGGTGWSKITRTIGFYEPLNVAGGINVAKDCGSGTDAVDVSKEQIIKWNPDIIIVAHSFGSLGGEPVKIVLSDPDLQTVNAIKNERVYYSLYPYCCGTPQDRNMANMMYLARLFHPDKFEDLDVEEEGNEIFKAFLGVDGLYTEYADYTIWIREWLDSQK